MLKIHTLVFQCFALLVSFGAVSCITPSGDSALDVGLVGSVTASADAQAKPPLLVRYDGNVLVAWATVRCDATIYWRDSEPRVYALAPISLEEGQAMVRVRGLDLSWKGKVGDPLPAAASVLFSAQEAADWQLAFAVEPPSAEDDPQL